MGIKNLNTYRNLNSIVIMTMGLGLTVLFFQGFYLLILIKNSTVDSENAPHYFFRIQKNELNLFLKQINEIDDEAKKIIVPMISARIESINKRKPKEIIDQNNKSFWFINGERRISCQKILLLIILVKENGGIQMKKKI